MPSPKSLPLSEQQIDAIEPIQHENTPNAAVSARVISGCVGSLVTALAVTPLEVVKVHLQNTAPPPPANQQPARIPPNVSLCPRGCGTFVLNNGLFDCVLPKSAVNYFDEQGRLKLKLSCVTADTTNNGTSGGTKASLQSAAIKNSSKNVDKLGTFALIRKLFLKEGVRGIYAGLSSTLLMGVPSTVLYYTVYDELVFRARRHEPLEAYDSWIPLFAGSSARLLATMVTAPLELIRTRQASMVGRGGKEVPGMMSELKTIVRGDGLSGLYGGLGPTLARDVLFSGIYWFSLEKFRIMWREYDDSNAQPGHLRQAGESFVSGAAAGMIAAACTTPFDVVKTRQQAVAETMESVVQEESVAITCNHGGHVVYRSAPTTSDGGGVRPASSTLGYMRTIVETEGLSGLWRGNQARMIKVAPSCAIMITCYELGKQALAT